MVHHSSFNYENPLCSRFHPTFFRSLPTQAGVYFFLDPHLRPLYIGKADNLKKRLSSYWLAKPGKVPDHTLEMLEMVSDLQWEIHPSGKHALKRESELIRAIRPPYNIAGTDPIPYLYLGVRYPKPPLHWPPEITAIDFRLSHHEVQENYQVYGCYKHRGKAKAGYLALLRLLFVSLNERARFHIPARICQVSPPYFYQAKIPVLWKPFLDQFLRGENQELLKQITFRMLEKENLPQFMIPSLQTDLEIAQEFFHSGPQETRKVALALGLKRHLVNRAKMNEFVTLNLNFKRSAGNFPRKVTS
jgi:hypothetical protein